MRSSGFTLVEALVVLAMASILAVVAVPSFDALRRSSSLAAASNEMLAALHLARSEAIKRGVRTVVCVSPDGVDCATGGGWQQGWLVFHDPNNNALHEPGEPALWERAALPGQLRVTGNTPVVRYVSYTPVGDTRQTSGAYQIGTITLCHRDDPGGPARQIVISSTGRPRTVKLDACP